MHPTSRTTSRGLAAEADDVQASPARHAWGVDPRTLYRELSFASGETGEGAREAADAYLQECIALSSEMDADLPEDLRDLSAWMMAGAERTGRGFQDYLASRRAGEGRRYFKTLSQALFFLRAIAPTKMIDGAWLFGCLEFWQDSRFFALIRTYLEELGEGDPTQNHVAIYHRLLAAHGCDQWDDLPRDFFIQGAIQLALAERVDDYLPEVVGFNLGYEQPPLHLLITAHELNELGIDPYYFTLHVTVDNAVSGHAKRAIDAVRAAMGLTKDAESFRRRLVAGYRLNELGPGAEAIVGRYDNPLEVCRIFQEKSLIGGLVHSEKCKVAGRALGDWLSQPSNIPAFLAALEDSGWIRRHRDPEESPFWQLVAGARAKMFGVFTDYELRVLHDFIAGDIADHRRFHRRRRRHGSHLGRCEGASHEEASEGERALVSTYTRLGSLYEKASFLRPFLSPARHWTPEGMLATRMFNELYMREA